ncbi:MAG: hypothetical protein QOI38_710 [Sphingomonadales bacterium]|jgi:SPP1 gp7 family putative phage head morphogenesis protein|nr:hypothetical protein [Sphingomonadales bacterium]
MADPVDIRAVIGLPPEQTARAFDTRDELRLTTRWSEMFHDDHARAFTVAKIANLDLLETIRTSFADIVHNGGTFEQWQRNLVPMLQRAGWWGRVEARALTGTDEPVHVGPRRLRTIYQTNMRVSRAAGQWARIQASKDAAPYLRYVAVMDRRTRPLHRQWHGTILRVDDAWWNDHFPPCGWNCRCTVQQLSERDLERYGWQVSDAPPPSGSPRPFWRAGALQPEMVPEGIDPGFAYNPGQASMRAVAAKAAATLERAAAIDVAGARAALRELIDSPAFPLALSEPDTAFPVMVLGDELRARMGAQGRVAVLSSETYARQRRSQPEIALEQYRQLPQMGVDPVAVFQRGDRRLMFLRTADDRLLRASVRVGEGGAELSVVTVSWASAAELRRLQGGGSLLYGQIAGAIAALIAAATGEDDEAEDPAA